MKVVVSIMAAVALASCDAKGQAARETPPPAMPTSECRHVARDALEPKVFEAPTYREGGRVVMPIVFLDGTTAELVYPEELDLASLGVSLLSTSGLIEHEPGSERAIDIRFGTPDEALLKGEEPVECYPGVHGQVEVWETGDKVVPNWMFIPLHSWTAYIFDGNVGNYLTAEQHRKWANSLAAHQRSDGWLILNPSEELRWGPEHTGEVQVELGNISERAILLWPIRCRATPGELEDPGNVQIEFGEVGDGQAFASWCDKDAPMEVHVYADAPFIRDVAERLVIRNVVHTYDPSRYQIVP